jgi:hypothetical protein
MLITLGKTRASFQEKFYKIFNNAAVIKNLIDSPCADPVYPNKYIRLADGTCMGLGHFSENPNLEWMLYEQIEPRFDEIISEYNL